MAWVEGVIFDLDGTLLDTLDDIVDSGNSVLVRLGLEPISREKYKEFIGDGVRELFRKILEYSNVEFEGKISEAIDLMREEYSRRYLNRTRPYDGVYELLSFLEDRGYKVSILSNKQHLFVTELVRHFFGEFEFVSVRGVDVHEDRKPNPKLALEVAEEMGVEPDRIIFVGDSATDVLTAKNAGMISVGVTWGFKTLDEIVVASPDYIVHHPREIMELVSTLAPPFR